MEFKKNNWSFGQKVRVIKTNSNMDGIIGTITGIASIHWFDIYIVTMEKSITVDTKIMPTFQSFVIAETHLEALELKKLIE